MSSALPKNGHRGIEPNKAKVVGWLGLRLPFARRAAVASGHQILRPSIFVGNVGMAFTRPISPAPVLSWILPFLTPSGSDFTFVLNAVRRFLGHPDLPVLYWRGASSS